MIASILLTDGARQSPGRTGTYADVQWDGTWLERFGTVGPAGSESRVKDSRPTVVSIRQLPSGAQSVPAALVHVVRDVLPECSCQVVTAILYSVTRSASIVARLRSNLVQDSPLSAPHRSRSLHPCPTSPCERPHSSIGRSNFFLPSFPHDCAKV